LPAIKVSTISIDVLLVLIVSLECFTVLKCLEFVELVDLLVRALLKLFLIILGGRLRFFLGHLFERSKVVNVLLLLFNKLLMALLSQFKFFNLSHHLIDHLLECVLFAP